MANTIVDKGSVARRPLDFEDYVDILRRNVSWIVGPVFFGLVVSTVVAYLLPDSYVSRAAIRIVPQQISDQLVQNVGSQDMTGRIESLATTILSRSTLGGLIDTYGLYKKELKSEPKEDVINKMHEAIGLRPSMGIGNGQSRGALILEISFKYRDRMLANKVCTDLTSSFLNNSAEGTSESQKGALSFLTTERDKAKAELDKAEQELTNYRGKHAGALPEEMQSNMAQMSAVQQRLNSLSDADSRASEQRLMIETALRSAKDRLNALRQMTPVSVARTERNSELDKQISELETAIASMKDRYTADYPDLQSAQERLGVLRRQRDEASKAPAKTSDSTDNPMVAREKIDAQAQVDQLEGQLKALTMGQQQISKELLSASGELRTFQGRLEASPAGEKEYMDLLQARESARLKYVDLDTKAHKSLISSDLNSAKQGETLELIDPASLPIDPTEPKRGLIIPIGAAGGLLLGIILVAIREVKDTSLKNLKDARVYTQLSVLGSIPLLENDVVVQRRKQVMLVSWAAATVLGIMIVAGSIAHYYMGKV